MAKRVKLLDVAKAAGVSQGTASNAFGKPDLVRAEVRERIFAAAKELGYRGPHVMARMLRTGNANMRRRWPSSRCPLRLALGK